MRKAFYLVVLFIFTAPAYAQKITEKDLLGTWSLTGGEFNGMTINYKTHDISFSPEMKEKYGDKAEEIRRMMSDELKKDKSSQQELFFEDGIKVIFRKENEEPLTWHYFIFEEEGLQYLHMNGGDFKMTMSGKVLVLSGEEDGLEITMTYEKRGEKK